jgi:hypothetical protein
MNRNSAADALFLYLRIDRQHMNIAQRRAGEAWVKHLMPHGARRTTIGDLPIPVPNFDRAYH